MKILDRHLSGTFLRMFWLCTATFLGLFLVVDFFEKLRIFTKHDPALTDVLLFFASKIPWMLTQVIPMATLLGTVLSVTLLARAGEITALRCGGIPLRRLVLPFLACGAVLTVATALIQETAAPRGLERSREIKELDIRQRGSRALLRDENLWFRSGNRILHVVQVQEEGFRLAGLTVAELAEGRVSRRVDAASAHWAGAGWVAEDAEVREFQGTGGMTRQRYDRLELALDERPGDFRIEKGNPNEATWSELRERVARYRRQGLDTLELEVGLWQKTSLPFVNLIMPLLAFPFAIRAGRRGSTSQGIVIGLGLGFTYWLVLAVGLSLGKTGALPPYAAAWAVNLVFGVLGVELLRRAERWA